MRFLLIVLALVLAACSSSQGAKQLSTPSSDPHAAMAADLRQKTVGLVEIVEDNDVRVFCSGVWVSDTSILTAKHCVAESKLGATVFYASDSDVYPSGIVEAKHVLPSPARLYAVDDDHDLALLNAPRAADHGVAHMRPRPVQQGMFVQAMGHSLGLWFTYSTGVVGGVRELDFGEGPSVFLQGTAPISGGNSGGGLFDENGELVGICHATLTRGQALNLWIPALYIDALLAKAAASGAL